MIEEEIYSVLANDPDLTSSNLGGIYHSTAPQGTELPYISFFCYADEPLNTFDGPNPTGNSFFQIEIFSNTAGEARDLITKVRAAMDGAETFVCLPGSRRGPYRVDPGYQHCRLEFSIWHN